MRTLMVTGASGYLGSRLVAIARADGRRVVALSRPAWSLGDGLPDAIDFSASPGEQAVIHLAHDWRDAAANEAGTLTLLHGCRRAGIGRFVFVSSQSAREDAANVYGRLKWRIEQALQGPGEVAARVGLVYGGRLQGQYGLLSRLTRRTPVLPMIDPWREVQPIHIDEVCRGLLALADGALADGALADGALADGALADGALADGALVDGALAGWVGLAGPVPIAFGEVLRTMARELFGRRLRIVPVPLRLALLACTASAALPFGPTIDRERVLGLAGTRAMPCAEHLDALGLSVQPLATGLRREPSSRRALLGEGRRLLTYVLRREPGADLLRRYAAAVAGDGEGPLPLPPGPLRFGEPVAAGSALRRRFDLAMILAEASPVGDVALAAASRRRRLGALAADGAADALALPVRLLRAGRYR